MVRQIYSLIGLLLLLMVINCGGGGGSSATTSTTTSIDTISDQTLQGQIGGISWTYVNGKASISSSDSSQLSIRMYDETVADICNATSTPSKSILFSVTAAVGTYNLSLGTQSVTLYDGTTNNIAVSGVIVISELTTDAVTGSNECDC